MGNVVYKSFSRRFLRKLLQMLPPFIGQWLIKHRPGRWPPKVGSVRFGSFRRVTPISRSFGFDRGQPIDRYYIESFLERHAKDIGGRVLEIQDNAYTIRFGGKRVTRSDVLNVNEGFPKTTIVADLTKADHLPGQVFDCIIFTQTLGVIYDLRAALFTLHRILKPSGVILATVPGISQLAPEEYMAKFTPRLEYYWSFTPSSVERLFKEYFPGATVEVESYGNVLTSICFLEGLSYTELRRDELDYHDPHYPMNISIRAQKRH
jgi:hypothetical protein